jgi:hypothetical protein
MLYILKLTLDTYLVIACVLLLALFWSIRFQQKQKFSSFGQFQAFFILAVVYSLMWPKTWYIAVKRARFRRNRK